MDALARRLEVEIVGDTKGLNRALRKAESDISAFGTKIDRNVKNMRGLAIGSGAAFAGGMAATEVLNQVKMATDAASNLNEQMSKAGVVFGRSSGQIVSWSKTTASAFGISQTAALEAAGTFGNITRSMGVAEGASADLSRNLVNLAGDLASFNNVGTDDALLALRSAIVGEYEPLRRLGSALSEARVQQQAMVETGKRNVKELTNQEKVLARYHLILKDTALAQGDAARTADSYANQTRQLAAKAADLQANIGTLLLPVMTEIVDVMNDGATAALGLGSALEKIGGVSLGPLGDVKNVLGDIANYATRIGPVGVVRNAADIAGLFGGKSTPGVAGNVPDPSGGLSGLIPTTAAGGGGSAPQSIFATAKAPLLNLPMGFQNATLRAQNENNRGGYLKQLKANRAWFEKMLQRAVDAGDTGAVNSLRQDLEGTQNAIQGVYAQMNAEADRVRQAAEDAREKAKQAAEERGRKVEDGILSLGDAVSQAIGAAADAVAGISKEMQAQADGIKSEALRRLDRRQSALDTARALVDAREQLRRAEMDGGRFGIRDARRALEDAELGRQRHLLEGANVTNSGGGFNISGATFHFHGVQNVDQLLAQLQKLSKGSTGQTRGKLMSGGAYGIG